MFKRKPKKELGKKFKSFKEYVVESVKNNKLDDIFSKYPDLEVLWLKLADRKSIIKVIQDYNWGVKPAFGSWVDPKDPYLEPCSKVDNISSFEVIDIDFEISQNRFLDEDEDIKILFGE